MGTAKLLEQTIKLGIYAILFTSLIFTPGLLFPYVTGKSLFFRTIVEIIVLCYAALVFLRPEYRPRKSPVLWAVLLWIATFILVTITSADTSRAIWGTIRRGEGLMLFLHLGAFFLVISGMFQKREDWLRLLKVSVAASIIFVLVNYLIIAPGQFSKPLVGTAGNSAFVGSYLLFQTFFALFLFLNTSSVKRDERKLWAGVFLFELVCLVLSAARVSVFGGVIGLALFFAFFVYRRGNASMRIGFLALVLLALVSYNVFIITKPASLINLIPILSKISDPGTIGTSFADRAASWRAGIDGFKARPLVGWGIDNYGIIFYRFLPSDFLSILYKTNISFIDASFQGVEYPSAFDQSHSTYINLVSWGGVVGFIGFFGILGAILFSLIKRTIEKKIDPLEGILLLSLLLAFSIQNIFMFDTLNSYIPLMVFFGLSSFLVSKHRGEEVNSKKKEPLRSSSALAWVGSCAMFIVVAILIGGFTLPVYYSATTGDETWHDLRSGNFDQALARIQSLFRSTDIATDFLILRFTEVINDSAFPPNRFPAFFTEVEKKLIKTREHHPEDPLYHMALGRLYLTAGKRVDPAYFAKAREVLEEASRLGPSIHEVYYDLGAVAIFQGDLEGAGRYFEKAASINPEFPQPYWYLGVNHILRGDEMEARETLYKAMRLNINYEGRDARWLIAVYSRLSHHPRDLEVFEKLEQLFPQNYQFSLFLANLYAKQGRIVEAKAAFERAVVSDPELAEYREQLFKLFDSGEIQSQFII